MMCFVLIFFSASADEMRVSWGITVEPSWIERNRSITINRPILSTAVNLKPSSHSFHCSTPNTHCTLSPFGHVHIRRPRNGKCHTANREIRGRCDLKQMSACMCKHTDDWCLPPKKEFRKYPEQQHPSNSSHSMSQKQQAPIFVVAPTISENEERWCGRRTAKQNDDDDYNVHSMGGEVLRSVFGSLVVDKFHAGPNITT